MAPKDGCGLIIGGVNSLRKIRKEERARKKAEIAARETLGPA